MSSISEIILITTFVGAGSFVQGSVGIGMGLVTGPLLAIMNPHFVPGPLLFSGLLLMILMAIRERQSIDATGIQNAILGRIVGTILASVLILYLPTDRMTILFGVLVILAVIFSLSKISIQPSPVGLTGAGLLSGFMGTTSALGGPPMALLYQNASGARLRSSLSGFFVIGVILSLVSLAIVGKFGFQEIRLALMMIPGIVIGYLLSSRFIKYFDGNNLNKITILIISTISALVVILKGLAV